MKYLDDTGLSLLWSKMKGLIPSSLPANGGNADTVDGKHYSDILCGSVTSEKMYVDNDTHIAKLGYLDLSKGEYSSTALMVGNGFWGNQHNCCELIIIGSDLNGDDDNGKPKFTISKIHLGGSYERTLYYKVNGQKVEIYVACYGGNGYGKWFSKVIGSNDSNLWNADFVQNCSSADLTEITYAGVLGSATKLANARTIAIGNTGKFFDGSGDVSWSLSEIGAAASDHKHYVGTTAVQSTSANQALSGISKINFVADSTDSSYIGTTVSGNTTTLDFFLSDDREADHFRWLFKYWDDSTTGVVMQLHHTWVAETALKIYDKYVSVEGHTHTFASLTDKPTTLSAYGILDAYTKDEMNTSLAKYLTLNSAQTITGLKTFVSNTCGALMIQRTGSQYAAGIGFRGDNDIYGYLGFNAAGKDRQMTRINSDGSAWYDVLDSSSTYIRNGEVTINGASITPLPLTGGTLTGELTTTSIKPSAANTYSLGTNALNYVTVYARNICGENKGGSFPNLAHQIALGYPNHDRMDFDEYGGAFYFNKTNTKARVEIASILSTGATFTMPMNIGSSSGNLNNAIKFGTGNAKISYYDNQVIFNTADALRFGHTDWDWDKWAGLSYDATNKIINLGLADGSTFQANNVQSGGTLNLAAVDTLKTSTGKLAVSAATTFSDTLNVTGATTLASTLSVTGATSLSGKLDVTGVTTLKKLTCSSLFVTNFISTNIMTYGVKVLSWLTAANAIKAESTLEVAGATTLSSTLSVKGSTSLSDLTCSSLSVKGSASLSSTLKVTGDTTLAANLSVGGDLVANGGVKIVVDGTTYTLDVDSAINQGILH